MVHVKEEIEPDSASHAVYEDMYQAYRNAYEGLTESGSYDLLAKIQSKLS